MLLLRLLCDFNCSCFGGVLTKVMCVVVCVSKLRVPLGAPPPSWWMVYLLLVIFASLPVVVGDNLGRQTCLTHDFVSFILVINCHLMLFWLPFSPVVVTYPQVVTRALLYADINTLALCRVNGRQWRAQFHSWPRRIKHLISKLSSLFFPDVYI